MKITDTRPEHRRMEAGRRAPRGRIDTGSVACVLVLIASALVSTCDSADGRRAPAATSGPPTASADDDSGGDLPVVDSSAFFGAFEIVQRLVLEETEEAMVVLPMVSSGGPGRLLLAEPREGQVNLYGTDGRLLRVLGSRGEGPGEFRWPVSAFGTPDDGVVVSDAELARLTFFPAGREADAVAVASPIPLVLGARDLGEGRYLLSGQTMSEARFRLLHLWNRDAGEIERSFLPVGVPEESLPYARSFTAVATVLEDDTIWAVWALSDTVYKFDRRGERLARIPLSLPTPTSLPGPVEGDADPRNVRDAMGSITQVNGLFILEDGNLVVQSMQSRSPEPVWDLTIVDRRGNTIWKAAKTPRLLSIEADLFYFDDPGSVLPNHWIVVRRKGAR